ncbi:uncharacterized protein BKA55DRAFT_557200 [Fusarium redolens]|uniref:Secreted protein n=1 Tax=Fusarium redolens TaxID=48865 RepID=A0A9P9KPQ1_FUSRE|nr:uncharacterized protein BKA55DRAFT_557200 [Fusarium redolens]KAH7264869.1 hypothetical protein BKA55DRAFT_557200 [Fusarium redolens]
MYVLLVWLVFGLAHFPLLSPSSLFVWSAFCFFDAGCEMLASTSIFSIHHFQPQKKSFIRQMAPDYANLQVDRLSFVLTLHHPMRSCSDWYDSPETNKRLTPKELRTHPTQSLTFTHLLVQQISSHSTRVSSHLLADAHIQTLRQRICIQSGGGLWLEFKVK